MTDGAVVSLWRYPVKSMMGEELNASDVTDHGLLSDRSLALVDTETGKVVSAKNPRKWPTMFDFRAVFTTPPVLGSPLPPVRVTLPDGVSVTSDSARFAELLTGALGRSVTLASAAPSEPSLEEYWPDIAELAHRETVTDEAMPSTTFFDLATIHVLTTATINRLRELYPQGQFEVRRFRPNIVVRPENDDAGFVESSWVGRELRIGDDVVLAITDHCPLRHDHTSARRSAQGQRDPAHSGTPQRSSRRRVWRSASRRESPARRHRDPRLSTSRGVDISRRCWESCHRKARCRRCLLNVELRGAHVGRPWPAIAE